MKKSTLNILGFLFGTSIFLFLASILFSYAGYPAPWEKTKVLVNDQPAIYWVDNWKNKEEYVVYLDKETACIASVNEKKKNYTTHDLSNAYELSGPGERAWSKKLKIIAVKEGKL